MTIRKTTSSALTTSATRGLVLTALMASLAGCGMIGSVVESDKVDYRGAKKAQALDVPPDLTQLQKDNRYAVPDGRGVATASGYQQARGTQPAAAAPSGEQIGVASTGAIRVERAGSQRWLVVNQTPEQLWPQLKQFWTDNGFAVASESSAAGTMETDWTENRAKLPQGTIRDTLGKVFNSFYSTGERDKYRTRLERAADGSTEIYISHRGMEEVLVGSHKESTTWTNRPNDPGLEAQFLGKLMAKLSGTPDVKTAESAVQSAVVAPQHAKLVNAAGGDYVEVDEGFDRAWRRVGLALDRVGFTVEDRDRVQGTYFVRYVDPDAADTQGFLSKLLSFGKTDDKAKEAQRYRILVKSEQGATASQVSVQNNEGKAEVSATGAKILKLLNDELK
ncbi:outer membrane protein assembly factor BamC [Massilia cavernae]|uniref:Outer membrane protein assembly factor BamC n=1 Tax=Massilia cavernae TaxID=2320864 RepID=A0A418XGF3_9BURK|nr:outer membrane protein assembly factor BamC [Massilia cavernae]RJG11525.1 outer membrane protein assembly factor BamC [Massilia cavernae]